MRLELRIQDSHKTKTKFFFIDNNQLNRSIVDHVLVLFLSEPSILALPVRIFSADPLDHTGGELSASSLTVE